MAISFKDSLDKAEKLQSTNNIQKVEASQIMDVMFEAQDVQQTYSIDDVNNVANWTQHTQYEYYSDYRDNSISNIDANKNIVLNSEQINITQEENSQYIPFEMNRYYDGFDLTTTNIVIHFVNSENNEDYDSPINVYYNDEKIKFGWLIDKRVTVVEGTVKFEIQAIGVNSQGETYIFKTKPCNRLNILQSLSGNGVIEPDNTWMTSFISQITIQVAAAQKAANEAKKSEESVKNTISKLPIEISDDGYSEITNQRKILHVQSTKSADKVNVVVSMEGGKKVVLDVEYDANNYPASMTINGHKCTFGWSGF